MSFTRSFRRLASATDIRLVRRLRLRFGQGGSPELAIRIEVRPLSQSSGAIPMPLAMVVAVESGN